MMSSLTLRTCALLLALAPALVAQQDPPTEKIVRLTLQPAAAPTPALKYQLLPELREMTPGNPIFVYLKCFSEQHNFFFDKKAQDQREKWLAMALEQLPVKELRGYGGVALRRADEAARSETPDWHALADLRRDGVGMLLPEVQQLRMLADPLIVRFRGEVADKRFEDATATAKTMLGLARCTEAHPAVITQLVGMALGHISIRPLEELIQQPGSPNLYWAFTTLPTPLISLRKGFQGERMLWFGEFAGIEEDVAMTESELRKVVTKVQNLLKESRNDAPKKSLEEWLNEHTKNKEQVDAARQRLVAANVPEGVVKTFPAAQVMLLEQKKRFFAELDHLLKATSLPYWQAVKFFDGQHKNPDRYVGPLAYLLPAADKVARAQAWLEQRFALLRVIEALRLHAAANNGQLPTKLDDVRVPLPMDPVTGKAFRYSVNGETAKLRGTPPRGLEKSAVFNVQYVITMKK